VDLDLLRDDVNKLQKDSFLIKNELTSLKEKTAGVATEESFNVVRQSQAEMQSLLSNVSRDIQVLSGRFDENKYFIEKSIKDSASEIDLLKTQMTSLENRMKELKDRLNSLEAKMKQQETTKEQTKESEKMTEEPQKEIPALLSDKTKYEAAETAYKNKKYKEAREKFDAFIKEFPKDKRTDSAQFWIAETYYGEKDFEGAIDAYETLLKKYPNSQKAPAALLKQGFSFIEIGDKKTGKVILEQLIEKYPNSKEAGEAKKKIEEIEKKTSKKTTKKKK
jgi:tol-pal system protein YbgF